MASSTQPAKQGRTSARKVKIRPATFDDHSQIAALESRLGLQARDWAEWTHLWQANPLYQELQKDWEIG